MSLSESRLDLVGGTRSAFWRPLGAKGLRDIEDQPRRPRCHGRRRRPMPKTTPRRISAQPSLVLRGRQELICGFAPRTLLLSRFHDALFVGCKDGSVTVVERASEEPHYKPHPIGDHNATTTSIRALSELDRGTLLLGRTDGTLTRCHWQTDPLKEIPVLLSGLP